MTEDATTDHTPKRLDIRALLDAYVADDQKVWEYDRNLSLGASEAFGCIRQAFYKKTGAAIDTNYKESWGALRRGDLIENDFIVPGLRAGLKKHFPKARLLGAGDKQKTFVGDRASATPDGLMVGLPRDCLAHMGVADLGEDPGARKGDEGTAALVSEFKSIDPRVNLREEKAIHNGQVQMQLGLIREQTPHKPNYAIIIYVDCSFFDDIDVYVVEFDQKKYDAGKKRAAAVFKEGAKSTDFMPEGRIDGSCNLCKFQQLCMKDTQGALPPDNKVGDVPEEVIKTVEAALLKAADASAAYKTAEKDKKQAQEELKEILQTHDVRRVKGEDWSVSLSNVKGRRSLDTEAVEAAGIDLEPFYKESVGHQTLRIQQK